MSAIATPSEAIFDWLIAGDVSIQYQTHRDLAGMENKDLQDRIEIEGWGREFLSRRGSNGHWGKRFYEPKWISSHYTLLDLRHLNVSPDQVIARETINTIANENKSDDGGVNPANSIAQSDVCVNGMFLYYACYFKIEQEQISSVIDFILSQKMKDGGYNCMLNRSGAKHSSLHSTLSILEGLSEYLMNGYSYRKKDVQNAIQEALEFVLIHRLYISDRTGEIIKKDFLRLAFPGRWKFDILRALDYFQHAGISWDDRMEPAVRVLLSKKNKNGTWNLQAKHPGQFHFEMEKPGRPSRWNTLRALRVLKYFKIEP